MTTIEELAQRVALIEQRLDQEAGLRASQDRDLSDMAQSMQAANALIQALAITQGQHTATLTRHTESLARIEGGLATIIALLNTLAERNGGEKA